ncbi:ankyrin repeat domain-containing protein [Candidatus Chromulinivorax destructor]|uniref:Peptidase A2 domain-containing protein n=1 Tax=Candidatus Chromulinivorax destructor TaxID=2066483 RepID=A0A345ZC79_9BACT|nr:ankyrin repeat domain-containing protein [Candidatus Chromulinivorax destructor]AXK60896.1 hypothetical protein C0J27_04080 [Candidatus Chromulinivorax destructor]
MHYKQHIRIISLAILTLATDITLTSQMHLTIGQKRKHEHIKLDAEIEQEEITELSRAEFIKQSVKKYSHLDEGFKLLRMYYSRSSIPTFHDYLAEKLYFDNYDDHDFINVHRNDFGTAIGTAEDLMINKMKDPFCMALEYAVRNHAVIADEQNKFFQYVLKHRGTFMRNIIPLWVNVKKNHDKPILHQAISCNNIEMIQFLLDLQADINIQDKRGNTPVHRAVINNNKSVIALLLEKGADVNIANNKKITPLHSAVKHSKSSVIVESLLNKNAHVDPIMDNDNEQGFTPLWQAVKDLNLNIVNLLLSSGADPNLGNTTDYNLLYTTLKRIDFEASLEYVAQSSGEFILEKLLQAGAKPNTQIDDENETPLFLAALRNLPYSTDLLLKYHANPNLTNNAHITPLNEAVNFGSLATIKILIQNKTTDLNICGIDDYGTALHTAVKKNYKEIVKLLLDAGADKTIVDVTDQLTPLELAETEEMRALFR